MKARIQLFPWMAVLCVALCSCGGGGSSGDAGGNSSASSATLELLAGNIGGSGDVDGVGPGARFVSPYALAVDAGGNVFVADTDSHTIRRISPSGSVVTFAGAAGEPGSADGAGGAARFAGPSGVAVDAAGNLYVVDGGNSTIRQITPSGVVSTFAGAAGQPGSADGPSGAARFNNPRGIAIDPAGDLYVGDTGNHTIRRITSAGEVSTLAGSAGVPGTADGVGGAAGFSFPGGVALDGLGNLYVADTDNHTIRRIALPGTVSTLAGTAGIGGVTDGMGTTAQFRDPGDVVADSAGNVYVADSSNHIIRKITPAGDVTTFAGTANAQGAEDGTGAAARFSYPWGIARDAAGTLYVAEGPANHTIRKVTAGAEVTTLAGAAELSGRVDAQGPLARFVNPQALAVGAAGNVYVAEGGSNVPLRAIDAAANVTSVAGTVGLSSPGGLARDAAGNLYVADTNNHVIRKVDPGGSMTVLAGMAGSPGSADGAALSATFNAPRGVAIHQATGIVYVADTDNHTIRAISPMGQVTTLAGTAGSRGSADGNGAAARFRFPNDLACDAAGSLYVADRVNNTIRKITPSGEVTTFAGSASSAGFTDGTGPDARFNFPFGIGIDALGNLFVADANNHAVRKITQSALVTTVVGAPGKIGVQLGALPASLFSPRDVAVRPDGQLLIVTANGVVVTQGF